MISPRHYNFAGQRGVTLTELLIVILIIAVIAGLALVRPGTSNAKLQRQNIARELKVAFERARFDSVKRRADSAGTWAQVVVKGTSFSLTTFPNGTSTSVTTNFNGQNIFIADGAGGALPSSSPFYTVYFNQRGEAVDSSGAFIGSELLVCNGTCPTSTPAAGTSNRLLVTRTGTVNLLAGEISAPVFPTPVGTVVPNTTDVNPTAVVP